MNRPLKWVETARSAVLKIALREIISSSSSSSSTDAAAPAAAQVQARQQQVHVATVLRETTQNDTISFNLALAQKTAHYNYAEMRNVISILG
jgi:hypothetical protein